MNNYRIFCLTAAAALLSACGNGNDEPEEVGGIADPQAEALANAQPIDPDSIPMAAGSDTYRCGGDVGVLTISWTRTGEEMSARITPADGAGVGLDQGEDGSYTGGDYTLVGGPDDETVTVNGQRCTH